jgi:uncharacterized phage-associated protein
MFGCFYVMWEGGTIMLEPYNVLDVSRYVINYSNEKDYGISNLKLQKVLYFIQAYFLTNLPDGKPCFKEKIEAWDFGPVVPEAYREYKQYGSANIPAMFSFIDFGDDIWDTQRKPFDNSIILDEHKQMINDVVDRFSDFSATDLVTLTHKQAPWRDAYVRHENNEITIEAIRAYFSE